MTTPSRPMARPTRRSFLSLLPALAAPLGSRVHAAEPLATSGASLAGRTASGQEVSLAELRGRVVLVFYWATDCAVCRDKMGELRANVAGWAGQPFTLLGVNMDKRLQDLADYERLVALTTPPAQRLRSIWAGGASYRSSLAAPARLPSTVLIDKQGQVVSHYDGRIPPQAWDDIAALL